MARECDKYEAFFTFARDDEFKKHIESCENCRQEHLRMIKISSLVKEVKSFYLKNSRKKLITKLVASMMFLIFCTGFVTFSVYDREYSLLTNFQESSVAQLGLPVDEYGLLTLR